MTAAVVEHVDVAAYRIPTDLPEGDGTLAWDATTAVVVHVGGGCTGLGWTFADRGAPEVVRGLLSDVVVGRDATRAKIKIGESWGRCSPVTSRARPSHPTTSQGYVSSAIASGVT